jgi:hypothetical protein
VAFPAPPVIPPSPPVIPPSPPVIPPSPPVIPPVSPPSSPCANTLTNAAGIPAIKANARIDVITIEWIFDSITLLG